MMVAGQPAAVAGSPVRGVTAGGRVTGPRQKGTVMSYLLAGVAGLVIAAVVAGVALLTARLTEWLADRPHGKDQGSAHR